MKAQWSPVLRGVAGAALAAVGAAAACSTANSSRDIGSSGKPLELAAATGTSRLCVDPPGETTPATDPPVPALPTLAGTLTNAGTTADFSRSTSDRARVLIPLGPLDTGTGTIDVPLAGRVFRVQIDPAKVREDGRLVTLSSGGAPLGSLDLEVTYTFRGARDTRSMGISKAALIDDLKGTQSDTYAPSLWFTDVAGSCTEKALLHFGPFPADMPPLKFPEIDGCGDRCERVAATWVHVHLDVWRANQMVAVLENLDNDAQRSWAWKQPGIDKDGNSIQKTSFAYWFGAWDPDRYHAIAETFGKYWHVVLANKVLATTLEINCPHVVPAQGDAGAYDWPSAVNLCFDDNPPLGHHGLIGTVSLCEDAFTQPGCSGDPWTKTLSSTLHHEPLHWQTTTLHGVKVIKDMVTHWHGSYCLSSPETELLYCEDRDQHFVNYGEQCKHLDKLATKVDVYRMFTQYIGDLVFNGTLVEWPKPAPPTPKPPECVGDPGCLCPTGQSAPDGDWSPDSACQDGDNPVVCMKTKFNASDTVGICTDCGKLRGPGCPCNDLKLPCQQGQCWGDDTYGTYAAIGTCYMDPPPAWGCLANCEKLMGKGAFCMHDHPDHARCVPVGTTVPEASNCWWDGGHMDPKTLKCTKAAQCSTQTSCQSLGYPAYYTCDYDGRCIPDP